MKRYLILAPFIALVLIMAACTTEVTPTPTPPPGALEATNAWNAALNAGDLEDLANIYSKDTVFSFGPLPDGEFDTNTGIAEVLASDADDISHNVQITLSSLNEEGNSVAGKFSFTDDELNEFGAPPITGAFVATVIQGKIASIKATPDEATQQTLAALFAPPEPREITALVGAGRDTSMVAAFFPSRLVVGVGDTVTWKINSDQVHTVTFGQAVEEIIPVPGGGPGEFMLNPQHFFGSKMPGSPTEVYSGTGRLHSGFMFEEEPPGASPTNTFSLTFDTPGFFQFFCEVHPFMRGTVVVQPPINPAFIPEEFASLVPPVLSQAEIDVQVEEQIAGNLARLEGIKEAGKQVRPELGPNGTTIWHVQAGGFDFDPSVEIMDFLPKPLTIKEGDTVIWTAGTIHNVTFHPGRPAPEFIIPKDQEAGPPLLLLNPEILLPSKPSGEFDGTGFWTSGLIGGASLPGGSSFAMTFSKSGTFKYMCAIHVELGMKAAIIVQPR